MTYHSILITGATGSIGNALALQYASPGRHLILFGRDALKLEQVRLSCEALGAYVETVISDMRNRQDLLNDFSEICTRSCPDLLIINAGVSNTAREGEELLKQLEEVVDVNLLAPMSIVQAVLPLMRAKGSGQIALVSSLAAWYGLPLTPAYAATKAALKNYGESLQGILAGTGIVVSVVLPGFVESAMSRTVPGPKPFLMTAEQAATRIRKGLARGRWRISFPFPLNTGCWLLAVLPAAFSGWLVRKFGYHDQC